MDEKEKDNLNVENSKAEIKNKKSIFGLAKGMVKGTFEKGAELAKAGYEKTRDKINEVKDAREFEKDFLKSFDSNTYNFQIKGSYNKGELQTIRAFRDVDNYKLLIPANEPNLNLIKSKTTLITMSDNSEIKILYVEDKEVEQVPLKINEEVQENIQCFKAKFEFVREPLEKQITNNISNVVNQNVNVSGEHNGDINVISNIEIELDKFMNDVKNHKTKRFSKERRAQEEAVKIIGPVKETIINGEKNKTLMGRFLELLTTMSPLLVDAFKTFM